MAPQKEVRFFHKNPSVSRRKKKKAKQSKQKILPGKAASNPWWKFWLCLEKGLRDWRPLWDDSEHSLAQGLPQFGAPCHGEPSPSHFPCTLLQVNATELMKIRFSIPVLNRTRRNLKQGLPTKGFHYRTYLKGSGASKLSSHISCLLVYLHAWDRVTVLAYIMGFKHSKICCKGCLTFQPNCFNQDRPQGLDLCRHFKYHKVCYHLCGFVSSYPLFWQETKLSFWGNTTRRHSMHLPDCHHAVFQHKGSAKPLHHTWTVT